MQVDHDLQCLENLIAGAGGSLGSGGRDNQGPCDLLTEHLDTARRALQGNRRDECRMSLSAAMDSLGSIADKSERSRIKIAVRSLIDSQARKRPVKGDA